MRRGPLRRARPGAVDRPGRLPARQPRQGRHAAGGGPRRDDLRRGRRRGRRELRGRTARRRACTSTTAARSRTGPTACGWSMAIEEVRAASFRITYEMHDGPAGRRRGRRPGLDADGHVRPRRRAPAPAHRRRAEVPRRDRRRDLAARPGSRRPQRPGHLRRPGRPARPDLRRPAAHHRAGPGDRVGRARPSTCSPPAPCPATLEPDDVTTPAAALLSALTVDRADTVDPGIGGLWQGLLPPDEGWAVVDTVPAAELEGLTERGLVLAREHAGPLGPPTSLLDQTVLTGCGRRGRAARPDPAALFVRALRHGVRRSGRGRRDRAGLGDVVVAAARRPLRRGGPPPGHRAAAADLTAREPELSVGRVSVPA